MSVAALRPLLLPGMRIGSDFMFAIALRILNPRNWLKPVLKLLAGYAVRRAAKELARKLKAEFTSKKAAANMDRIFDQAQVDFYLKANAVCGKFPALCGLTEKTNHIIKEYGDALQKKIKQTIVKEGPHSIDSVLGIWRDEATKKINEL
ncbi:MAG: hypothetical protein QME66_05840 [Candidatus Eisenbacteria bacterium]|nr:hypothetical protein [Candidatus Eisenbacteria bacterium]